jgi:hypothetical protein
VFTKSKVPSDQTHALPPPHPDQYSIKNSEDYPATRKVVDDTHWLDEFKLRRSNDDAKPDAIRKSFNRARNWLQEYDYIREYKNKIWFIDEPDGQDK